MQLRSIQKLFSLTFPLDDSNTDTTRTLDEANSSQSSLCIDLSCLQDTKVTIPTFKRMVAGLSGCVYIRHRPHRRSNLQPIHQIPPYIQSSSMQERYHREGLSLRGANKVARKCGLKHFWRG